MAPLYASEAAVPVSRTAWTSAMATARHRVKYVPGTRLAKSAEIDLFRSRATCAPSP